MAKTAKVKGYGAYWKGDVRNKTIARKNKQYISDQRCLRVYKKQLQKQSEPSESDNSKYGGVERPDRGVAREPVGGRGIAEDGVKVIKPQIETVYYVHGASGKGVSGGAGTARYEEAGSDEEDEESVDGGYDDGDASDDTGVAQETTARARKEAVDTELEYEEGGEEAQSIAESEDDSDGGLPSPKRGGLPRGNKEADGHIGVGKKGAKLGKRGREWEEEEGGGTESKTGGKASGRQKGKYSGVYAKALKLREEQIKIKQQLHNERIEKIKQKKREIREKKQERYARHRLLGKKTKRGQPIMANVISHLMNNFQKKQR